MSRKGKQPVVLPKGVEAKLDGNKITIKGPKGTLSLDFNDAVEVHVEPHAVVVKLKEGNVKNNQYHGLYRTLIDNIVMGVSKGFEKILEMVGVGYRATTKGAILDLSIGFSHPTELPIPKGLSVVVEKNTTIVVSGIDKQAVGQFAAEIRSMRPPEPYQGKGIRYKGEYIRRKAGKASSK